MATTVADLLVTLSLETEGFQLAERALNNIARANAVVAKEVGATSAQYDRLVANVQHAVAALEEVGVRSQKISDLASSMSFDEAIASADKLNATIREAETLAGYYKELDAVPGAGIGTAAYDQVAEQIGYTKEELNEYIQSLNEEVVVIGSVIAAHQAQALVAEQVTEAEANLEKQTNSLVRAQSQMEASVGDTNTAVEKSGGALRSSSARMNYYIQALASGNVTQTLIGQSAAMAGQGIQKLQMAMQNASGAGGKLAAAGNAIGTSIRGFLNPTTAAIAVVGVAVTLWMKWKKSNEENKRAIKELSDALLQGQQALDGWVRKTVEVIAANDDLVESLENVGKAGQLIGFISEEDLGVQVKMLEILQAEYDALYEKMEIGPDMRPGRGADPGDVARLNDLEAIIDKEEELLQLHRDAAGDIALRAQAEHALAAQARDTLMVYGNLGEQLEAGMVGTEETRRRIAGLTGDWQLLMSVISAGDSDLRDAFRSMDITGMDSLVDAMTLLGDKYPELKSLVSLLTGELDKQADAARRAADGIQEQADAARAAVDAGFALARSVKRAAEAAGEMNRTGSPEAVFAFAEAMWAVQVAAAANPDALPALTAQLADMYAAGLFTAAQYEQLLGIIAATSPISDAAAGGLGIVSGAVDTVGTGADIAAGQVGSLNEQLGAVNGTIPGTILNINALSNAVVGASNTIAGAAKGSAAAHIPGQPWTGKETGLPNANKIDWGAVFPANRAAWGGSGGGGGGGGGGGATTDGKGLAIDEIKKFFEQVNRAIKAGIQGGVLYSDEGNAVPVGSPYDFIANEGGVNVQTINLRGVWDFADPTAKREIVRQMKEALAQFEKEVA